VVAPRLENRDYGRRGSAVLTTQHPSTSKKLALTKPTRGGRSVGRVRSRTKATYCQLDLSQIQCGEFCSAIRSMSVAGMSVSVSMCCRPGFGNGMINLSK
jgi:hypothetical protein